MISALIRAILLPLRVHAVRRPESSQLQPTIWSAVDGSKLQVAVLRLVLSNHCNCRKMHQVGIWTKCTKPQSEKNQSGQVVPDTVPNLSFCLLHRFIVPIIIIVRPPAFACC